MVAVPDEKNTPPTVAPATAKRSRAGTKGELRERLRNAKKKRKITKNDAMTFAKALDQHIDGIVKS